jgi:hypothetical protein
MTLKVNTKTVHQVEYGDWNSFVNSHYELEPTRSGSGNHTWENPAYEFVADVECGNDTSHEYDDITKAEAVKEFEGEEGMAPFNRADLEEWKSNNGKKQLWGARLLLLDLVRQDLIPEGNYIISVCW